VAELEISSDFEHDGTVAVPSPAAEIVSPAMAELESAVGDPRPIVDAGSADAAMVSADADNHDNLAAQESSAVSAEPEIASGAAEAEPAAEPEMLNPAVAELCVPLSQADPCGPDLDLDGDTDYLNFFAQAEGILPSSFFSAEDGRPFDRANVNLVGQIEAIAPLWARSRDMRLLVIQARIAILNRDVAGFAVAIAAIAEWLENFWDDVHPRAIDGDLGMRAAALGSLDLPTVVFPLQYAPLCEGRRTGAVTYRAWMIASGEVKPRTGEQKQPSAALTEAIADAPPAELAAIRRHVALLKKSLVRIRETFMAKGVSLGLENLPALVDKIQLFVDPRAAHREETAAKEQGENFSPAGDAPASLAQAQQALAAIAGYYSRSEPSSPTLPLVRQAHQLIGKSFFEVMSILVPTQLEKAAFQIGADQFFELPVSKLSKLPEGAPSGDASPAANGGSPQYIVTSRVQAIALLEQVQRFFRHSEPSSPVPMLCDRARAFAERDFMGVLREVLPKAALKTFGAEK
jgi:type VI secretion system protein ImpA